MVQIPTLITPTRTPLIIKRLPTNLQEQTSTVAPDPDRSKMSTTLPSLLRFPLEMLQQIFTSSTGNDLMSLRLVSH